LSIGSTKGSVPKSILEADGNYVDGKSIDTDARVPEEDTGATEQVAELIAADYDNLRCSELTTGQKLRLTTRQNLPLLFFHSLRGAIFSVVPQCSTAWPSSKARTIFTLGEVMPESGLCL